MSVYRLLYFNGGRLERSEVIEAPDRIAAIQQASGQSRNRTIEIWRGDEKLAIVHPAPEASQ